MYEKRGLLFGIACVLLVTIYGLSDVSYRCDDNKFKCASEKCIPVLWQCDGDDDCGDGSDEVSCAPATCRPDIEFTCRNRKCIPNRWKCDKEADCADGSDEDSCPKPTCAPNYFQCNNSRCVPEKWKCDKQDDCGDKSDELSCGAVASCKDTEFKCGDGSCIFKQWVCDGEADCKDKTDEEGCKKSSVKRTCGPNEFTCNNDRCILERWHCDGTRDCIDGSDETNCSMVTKAPLKTCSSSFWQCSNGDCIRQDWECDGEKDCSDNSDEKSCDHIQCHANKFACKNRKQCIFKSFKCDGEKQCDDGSDEEDCAKVATKCGVGHFNCSDGTCIEKSKVCNLVRDCPGGDDEPVNCFINECTNFNGHCMHNCTDEKIGYKCSCRKGYKLSSDRHSCEDVNECNEYGKCHQLCENTKGHYKCSCADGYLLKADRITCKATGDAGWIYFANRHDIRKLLTDGSDYTVAVSNLSGVVSFDFHIQKQYIYWTDIVSEEIKRATINTPNTTVTVLGNVHTPDGLAVDWVSGNLYWTDTGYKSIEVSDLNGNHNMDLVLVGLSEPRAIALNPREGYLYWSDWGKTAGIEKISMDGKPSTRKKIISENIVWPNGLTLDLGQQRLYWIDAKLKRVEVADLDGGNRLLVKETGFAHPFSLDNFEDMLYWSDWRLDGVTKMSKFNTTAVETVQSGLYAPMDVKVMHAARQKSESNPCGTNNYGCSHLCLLANHYGHRIVVCKCPRNMQLDDSNKKCIGVPVTRGPKPTTQPPIVHGHTSRTPIKAKTTQSTKLILTKKPVTQKIFTTHKKMIPTIDAVVAAESLGSKSGMGSGAIAAIILSVVIGIILVVLFVFYMRRRGLNKSHVMYYKDMSTKPLEEDFDIENDEIDEKAKIISNDFDDEP